MLPAMNPAEAIAAADQNAAINDSAPAAAAWLTNPTTPGQKKTLLAAIVGDPLAGELERGDCWDGNTPDGQPGRWLGTGPEPQRTEQDEEEDTE
jgi:hypothetical protein